MTNHLLIFQTFILSASIVAVLLHIILRQLRKRINIRRYINGVPVREIAYVKQTEGKAAEAFLPNGAPKIVGRVIIDKAGDKALVQLRQSRLDDDTPDPIFKRAGYIGEDGYIYEQTTKNGPVKKLGYVANPKNPAVPSLEGWRSWKTLWLHKYLDVYRLKDGVEEIPVPVADLPLDAPQDIDELIDQQIEKIDAKLDAIADAVEESVAAEEAVVAEEPPVESVVVPVAEPAAEPVAEQPAAEPADMPVEQPAEQEEKKKEKKKKGKKEAPKAPSYAELVARCDMQGFGFPRTGAITAESRAGAYALFACMYPKGDYDEFFSDPKHGWRDTALLASVMYLFGYIIYYLVNTSILQRPLIGKTTMGIPILYGFYFVVWALLRSIKVEQADRGNSFQPQLNLFNKRLGQRGIDIAILIMSLLAIPISIPFFELDFVPLLMAIATGIGINFLVNGTARPWWVKKSYSDKDNDEPEEDENGELATNQPPAGEISCSYDWDLDYDGVSLHGNISIRFDSDFMREERQNNPFFSQSPMKSTDVVMKMFDMLCKRKDYMERMRYLANYIQKTAQKADLAEHIKLQFALDFIQEPNIRFVLDENSERIQKALEYMRLPDETLYDKEGDYDCKSFFAAMLFYAMGYDVLFLYSSKHKHYAIAVEERYKWTQSIWAGMEGKHKMVFDDRTFVLCETIADHFRVGDLLDGLDTDDFDVKELFEHQEPGPELEELEYRSFDWNNTGKDVPEHGMVVLGFNLNYVGDLRKVNPFRQSPDKSFLQNAEEMLLLLRSKPKYTSNLSEIAWAVSEKCKEKGLSQIQFALNFTMEPNIQNRRNDESPSIAFTSNYLRYPDEVLFDKEADGKSKLFFAAVLLGVLGYDTMLLKSAKGSMALAVEYFDGMIPEGSGIAPEDVTRDYDEKKYILCGMLSRNVLVAAKLKDGESVSDFDSILEIHKFINE